MTAAIPVSAKPAGAKEAEEEKGPGAKRPTSSSTSSSGANPHALAVKFAGVIRPYLDKATPALVMAGSFIDTAEPYFFAAIAYLQHIWAILQPYHPQEFLPAIAGFVLVFFGGNFFTICAAVEAYRLVGFDDTKIALEKLRRSYGVARAASAKDDEVDADGNGVADVKEIDKKQLVLRKMSVVAKAVDPELVADALHAIYAGLTAVVATLRIRFAACVTLGITVGGIAHNIAETHLEPVIFELTPPDYRKWVAPSVKYGCRVAGVTIAWFLQMTMSAFHSSARGAQLFARGVLAYAVRHKYLQPTAVDEKGRFFNLFIVAFGFLGFWSQFWSGFALPFPLNLLLLPVRLVEWGLRFLVFLMG
eukprot:CAMPEP_0197581922 /NCGR_PEP_ID=MMETSP1326-20131121/5287_1 /TAXON_ID=1155430 /ORGANISM="Genus nov. species nov., Strain RCC2288" /LENGTH=361 /DNA_ID=CAMNT_0043145901 /DNA_START=35 /DNA_END=1120 /DNA_ORIENTATION=+